MIEVRALANPKPLRDLARGVAFSWIPEAARALHDPANRLGDKIKLWAELMKYSVGQPSMAELLAQATEVEIQEARAMGMLNEALRDPGVRSWALEHRPELLRALAAGAEARPEPEDLIVETVDEVPVTPPVP
jgi:hypothetical protein